MFVNDMTDIYLSGILLSQKTSLCNNMEGLGRYYTKSNRESQILYDITYILSLKIQQTSEYNNKIKADSQIQRTI